MNGVFLCFNFVTDSDWYVIGISLTDWC